jgi:hypothetical protein
MGSRLLLQLLKFLDERLGATAHVAKFIYLFALGIEDYDGWIALDFIFLLQGFIGLL